MASSYCQAVSGARGDSVSMGGVVRAEREAAGRAIGCVARVSVPSGATKYVYEMFTREIA